MPAFFAAVSKNFRKPWHCITAVLFNLLSECGLTPDFSNNSLTSHAMELVDNGYGFGASNDENSFLITGLVTFNISPCLSLHSKY